jgi:hypothetical protein
MKNLSVFFGLLLLLSPISSFATPGDSTSAYPKTLKCDAGQFVRGLKDFNDPSGYFPIFIHWNSLELAQMSTDANPPSRDPDIIGATPGNVRSGHGIVRFEFIDGDQYSLFDLGSKDLQDLEKGKVSEIHGTFEDGYDWVNGYNTRAVFQMKCSFVHLN